MQDTTLKCYGKSIKVSLNTKFNDDSSQNVYICWRSKIYFCVSNPTLRLRLNIDTEGEALVWTGELFIIVHWLASRCFGARVRVVMFDR